MIYLAILQGLTEFLPVSSSGHLIILKNLLHVKEQGLSIEVYLHLGTLLAVLLYYFKDIWDILIHWKKNLKYIELIILGSIPTAIIGFIIYKLTNDYTFSIKMIGLFYLINSLFLLYVDRFQSKYSDRHLLKETKDIGIIDAILIGTVQGMAAFPGISRSGSTVGSAILRGINAKDAAKFSFLLSIPAIGGAFLLEYISKGVGFESNFLIPMLISFGVGYLAIHLFIKILTSHKLRYFAFYTFLLSLICFFI